ncbi:MAG: hypothetical protein ACJAUW_001921 [Yoonia sp.]|jgi:hypothetical protein
MRVLPILLCLLSACATFPQLDGTISATVRNAPYPLLTPVPLAPQASGDVASDMQARVAALQARAATIRQIDIAALQ